MRGGHKAPRCAPARLETVAVGAFDGARELHSGGHVNLAKNVAQVSLHRLLAEKQFGSDLGVRLPVDDQACDLQLARGQGLDPGRAGLAAPCSAMDVVAELAQFALGLVTPTQCAAGLERRRSVL